MKYHSLDATLVAAVTRESSQLVTDENVKLYIYLDPRGHPTFGIGSFITKDMQEYGMEVGTPVSRHRVFEAFYRELDDVAADLKAVYGNQFLNFPTQVQLVSVNMMYHLGRPRYLKFVRMVRAIKREDWYNMKVEMIDSRWYKNFNLRATRLIKRIEPLIDKPHIQT